MMVAEGGGDSGGRAGSGGDGCRVDVGGEIDDGNDGGRS